MAGVTRGVLSRLQHVAQAAGSRPVAAVNMQYCDAAFPNCNNVDTCDLFFGPVVSHPSVPSLLSLPPCSAPEVRVLAEDKTPMGVMATEDALAEARALGIDMIMVGGGGQSAPPTLLLCSAHACRWCLTRCPLWCASWSSASTTTSWRRPTRRQRRSSARQCECRPPAASAAAAATCAGGTVCDAGGWRRPVG